MKNVVVVLALLAAPLTAAEFYPIASVTSSTAADDLFAVANLIEGPGVGYQAEAPHDRLGLTWVTAAPGGFPTDYIAVAGSPVISLDLGSNVDLFEISAWGYSSGNANGVSEFSLRFATEADGPAGFGTSVSYNPTLTLVNDNTVRQSNLFDETVSARYVEFTALDNFFIAPGDGSGGETPGGDRVGLGEIAFQVVPEPTTATLLLGAFIGFASFGRRRRRDR